MALTDLITVKSFLNIPASNTSQDEWLDALRSAAEVAVESFCGRRFLGGYYTEYLTGNNRSHLALRNVPVRQVFTVHVDSYGRFGQTSNPYPPETLLTEGTDYALERDGEIDGMPVSYTGILTRYNQNWPEIPRQFLINRLSQESGPAYGNIKVYYRAGYDVTPRDVEYAVAFLVSHMRRTIKHGAIIGQERIGAYSYELHTPRVAADHPELATARQLLSRYREVW